MKVSRLLSQFLALLILNSSLSSNFILKTTQDDKKLSNYVCKITKDIIKSKSDTQDVLIGNLGGKMWSSTVNDITGCVGHDSAAVVTDFKQTLKEKTLRKAAVIVLLLSDVSKIAIKLRAHNRNDGSSKTVWHHLARILLVVPASTSEMQIKKALQALAELGFINVACVHETKTGHIEVDHFESLLKHKISSTRSLNASIVFPDKLKNMNGYAYRIPVYSQIPRVFIKNGNIMSLLTFFIAAVNKLQNSTVKYSVLRDYRQLQHRWNSRLLDMTFNTGLKMITNETEFMTYEERSNCALVPLPPKIPLFQSIFIKPFDGLTWLFLVLTMACCVAVFWMFRARGAEDSPWLLAYGMFVMFVGQGVDFSRKNRLVLTILLQLIIVMIWVLCNAYEGVVTSFMIQPIIERQFETFDDLVASNYKIITGAGFALSISNSDAYRILKPRLNTSGPQLGSHFAVELKRARYVFILNCDEAEILIPAVIPGTTTKVSQLYYLLPQKIYPYMIRLAASYANPFLERLQYYMDLSFQAGLLQIWELYHSLESPFKKKYEGKESDEVEYLKLEDLYQVFGILVVGFGLAAVLFLLEIFFHDILVKLKLKNFLRKLRNRVHQLAYKKQKQGRHPKYQKGALYYIIHRRKRVKRLKARKLRVRRIYVQPRFPMD